MSLTGITPEAPEAERSSSSHLLDQVEFNLTCSFEGHFRLNLKSISFFYGFLSSGLLLIAILKIDMGFLYSFDSFPKITA